MTDLRGSGESIRDVMERVIATPDAALSTAEFVVAGWKVRLRTTSPKTTELYSSRLSARQALGADGSSPLQLNLVETDVLGWPPLRFYSDWNVAPDEFEPMLRGLGLRGVYYKEVDRGGLDYCAIFDPHRQVGVQFTGKVSDLPPWEAGAPCRILLNLAAVDKGSYLMHGATLALGEDGVLILGPGGVGKSCTTLAGISVGLKTVGDDYVLVSPGAPPTARRMYNLIKVTREHLEGFGALAADTAGHEPNWRGKLEIDPEQLYPGCLVERIRLRAMLMPEFGSSGRTKFAPIDPQVVFQQLAPALWKELPGAQTFGFRFAAWLTRSLPTYTVRLSNEPAEIGDSISSFIAGLRT